MKKTVLILFYLGFVLTAISQNYASFDEMQARIVSKTIPLISVEELKKIEKTRSSFLILDAREKIEYDVSHIKKAKFVGYDNFDLSEWKKVNKETIIIVYCSVGYRSEKVGEQLKKAGFNKILNLKGGIFDWVNSGFPVYDNAGNETKKIHAYNKSWGKWLTKGEKIYE